MYGFYAIHKTFWMCALRCLLCRIYYISKISMEQLEIKTQWFDDESCVHLNWIENHARAFVFLCVCIHSFCSSNGSNNMNRNYLSMFTIQNGANIGFHTIVSNVSLSTWTVCVYCPGHNRREYTFVAFILKIRLAHTRWTHQNN